MIYKNRAGYDKKSYQELRNDCSKCFGFCCTALYFSASDGFPADKAAGKPCINLQQDFKCAVHKELREKGLKGCTAYDCFGAGQKVAQVTYGGRSWRQDEKSREQMFDVFLVMRQLHEMLWYLKEALRIGGNSNIQSKLSRLISETEDITLLSCDSLIALDLEVHRTEVNSLLEKISEIVRSRTLRGQKSNLKRRKTIAGRQDLIGADLRKTNLRGADLRGAFLIAADLRGADLTGADLIGADMRDADIKGTDLTDSIFLTQSQINTAKGDSDTKLPISLSRPLYWDK
ncbi:MAG: pentapeptide repeat-containing protein [Bacillota bacterium]|nr:pentapeptide repeat-containing protein [Bacillota bacterium]